jgi:kynurenine formamidase
MSCQPTPDATVGALTRRVAVAVTLLLILSGCSVEIEPASRSRPRPVAPWEDFDLVDLTHSLGTDSLYWPNGSQFEYERQIWGYAEDGKWYAMGYFATPEHLGTHLDAPIHFAAETWTNSEIPVERFFAPAVVIDISERAATDPDTGLLPADIDGWVERHGPLPEGAIVIVRTGWSEKWPDWNAYYGSEDPFDTTTLRFPGVSAAGAEQLVEAGVVGVGIDTASIDPGQDATFESHRVLAEAQLFNLENLTNVGQLPESGAWVIALPAKVGGGSGAPARVIALVPADTTP